MTAVANDTADAEPDAALIALGAELEHAWASEDAVFAALAGCDDDEAEAITDAALNATRVVVEQIEAYRATTLAGIMVKARAASWCWDGAEESEAGLMSGITSDRVVYQIVRDLLVILPRSGYAGTHALEPVPPRRSADHHVCPGGHP